MLAWLSSKRNAMREAGMVKLRSSSISGPRLRAAVAAGASSTFFLLAILLRAFNYSDVRRPREFLIFSALPGIRLGCPRSVFVGDSAAGRCKREVVVGDEYLFICLPGLALRTVCK